MKTLLMLCAALLVLSCSNDDPTGPKDTRDRIKPYLTLTQTGWNYNGSNGTITGIVTNSSTQWDAYNVAIHAEADRHYDSRRGIWLEDFNVQRSLNPSTVEPNSSCNVSLTVPYYPQRYYLTWN